MKTISTFNKILSGFLLGIMLTGTAFAVQVGFENGNAYFQKQFSQVDTLSESVGANIATNPSIDTWVDGTPTDYTIEIIGEDGGSVIEETTIVHEGGSTSSAKIIGSDTGAGAPGGILVKTFTGLTPGDLYRVTAFGKIGTGEAVVMYSFDASPYASATQYYDEDTGLWVALPGTATYSTVSEGDWDDVGLDYISVPASGTIALAFAIRPSVVPVLGATGYVDDISMTKISRPTTATEIANFFPLPVSKNISFDHMGQGAVALYTVPEGYKLIIATMQVEATEMGTLNSAGTYSMGTTSPYTDILVEGDSFPLVVGDKVDIEFSAEGVQNAQHLATAGETVYFKLITPWDTDGDSPVGTIYLWGALIKTT